MKSRLFWPVLAAFLILSCAEAPAGTPEQYYVLAEGEKLPSYRVGQKMTGTSACYGQRLQGNRTASGRRFDWHEMTAAHRTLPFGTKLKVTNRRNGREVVVTVTDRGPRPRKYVLDLSRGAAEKLSMRRAGIAPVTMEILELPAWYAKEGRRRRP